MMQPPEERLCRSSEDHHSTTQHPDRLQFKHFQLLRTAQAQTSQKLKSWIVPSIRLARPMGHGPLNATSESAQPNKKPYDFRIFEKPTNKQTPSKRLCPCLLFLSISEDTAIVCLTKHAILLLNQYESTEG